MFTRSVRRDTAKLAAPCKLQNHVQSRYGSTCFWALVSLPGRNLGASQGFRPGYDDLNIGDYLPAAAADATFQTLTSGSRKKISILQAKRSSRDNLLAKWYDDATQFLFTSFFPYFWEQTPEPGATPVVVYADSQSPCAMCLLLTPQSRPKRSRPSLDHYGRPCV